jgi:hypothetical protein
MIMRYARDRSHMLERRWESLHTHTCMHAPGQEHMHLLAHSPERTSGGSCDSRTFQRSSTSTAAEGKSEVLRRYVLYRKRSMRPPPLRRIS